ncbi:MAG: fatty acid desaturase [Chryseolinea sp.]
MRDKHLHIDEDNKLLRTIQRRIAHELVIDEQRFAITIVLKLIFYLGASCASYVLLFRIEQPTLFVLCFILYGFCILLLAFNFAHDFSHGTIFRRPLFDNICFTLIYTLNGAHAEAWKRRHIESHHFAPNVENYDSDLEITSLIRVLPNSPNRWFHRFQHIYAPLAYTTYSLYWVFIKDFHIFFNDKRGSRYAASFVVQKAFYVSYILIIPILYSLQPWYVVLFGFVAMHLCQSLFLLLTFFMTHHVEGLEYPTVDSKGTIAASWLMNQVKSSNDMYPFSETANFIFGGFNNHIAHHLFPHIHHVHYAKLSRLLYRILNEHGITPHQTTYWGGICSHLKLLKRMSEGPGSGSR